MFTSMNSTDEWELDQEEVITINRQAYLDLVEDSKMLYALRKIGAVSTGIECEAIEFLKEEGE